VPTVDISQDALSFLRERVPPGVALAELSRPTGLEESYVRRFLRGRYLRVKAATLSKVASAWDLPDPQWEEFEHLLGTQLSRTPPPIPNSGHPSLCEGLILIEAIPGMEHALLSALHRKARTGPHRFRLEAGMVFTLVSGLSPVGVCRRRRAIAVWRHDDRL
jgi:hypothetical protein